mmetsp:Transcript_6975/g.21155  ORF Transcript_6975/g.21155 Transcript_6975/m.21155 type:complete len:225 (-) Transcript_6975:23-697(-)
MLRAGSAGTGDAPVGPPDDDDFDEQGIGDVSLKTNLRVPTEGAAVSASVCELAETAASMSPPRLACSTSQVAMLDVASSASATRGLSLIAGANGVGSASRVATSTHEASNVSATASMAEPMEGLRLRAAAPLASEEVAADTTGAAAAIADRADAKFLAAAAGIQASVFLGGGTARCTGTGRRRLLPANDAANCSNSDSFLPHRCGTFGPGQFGQAMVPRLRQTR